MNVHVDVDDDDDDVHMDINQHMNKLHPLQPVNSSLPVRPLTYSSHIWTTGWPIRVR